MDFLSLFDPSEDNEKHNNKKRNKPIQDTVKKKPDAPKGKRRGRRSQKNATLPEESSFLCEPDLSTEILVKDVSYIENFLEAKKNDDKNDDVKPKRRNSGRKNRRKKNKISPIKDQIQPAWTQDEEDNEMTNWNNHSSISKITDENSEKIGKNVNNLTKDYTKKRKNSLDFDKFEKPVYNVIDKLEKVNLKDDMYLAGDFNTDDLENDFAYSSDDLEEAFEDTNSELDDSGDEVYGSLPPEPRFGNVEYKLQLVSPCERRFQHLVTQLKWRLCSGGGTAVYVLGVRDDGSLRGLRARALRASLHALRRMATALQATLAHVTARRVTPHRAVAEVYIRKLPDTQQSVELRVAVMGANEAGKSTLIGVLTQGELDNGRGSARLNMFRHPHEVNSGRTSSLSHEILGFDAQGNVVNYGCSELMTAERIGERSAKLVSFLDLAGHSKYQRTTLHGLTGYSPHYAMLVISATAGIKRITEEHIGLLLALELPFFTVISKCELAPAAVPRVLATLTAILTNARRRPLLITDENLARSCVAPQKLILDTLDDTQTNQHTDNEENDSTVQVPVFPVSCVRGMGLRALHAYLLALLPPTIDVPPKSEDEAVEFQIDEVFHVDEAAGPVVGGLLARGKLCEGDQLIVGPLEDGSFVDITVRSIYRNRVPCGVVTAGQSASLGLHARPVPLRPGMALLDNRQNQSIGLGFVLQAIVMTAGQSASLGLHARPVPLRPGMALLHNRQKGKWNEYKKPVFNGCMSTKCKKNAVPKIISEIENKNPKHERRKNKNLLADLTTVEKNIEKPTVIDEGNLYKGDGDDDECSCKDELLLEDPNDPRGCIYFQASVHVLRHSTAIYPGFQCSVHVGNVRQTAIIEGILSHNNVLRSGSAASVVFRFLRCPEYLVRGRRLLFTAGLGTRGIGRITQVFPYVP